jgi:hypothetical protein
LLVLADIEEVLQEMMPFSTISRSKKRRQPEEALVLVLGAKAHHPLDPGPVVPGAVEEDHLARGRELGDCSAGGRAGSSRGPTVPAGPLLEDAGLQRWVIRLITPPLARRVPPSKTTMTLAPSALTQACSRVSSTWSR